MADGARPRANNDANLYTLQHFQQYALNHCRQEYEWVTKRFKYTFAMHKDNGKDIQLLAIAKKQKSKTKLAWVALEDDHLQYYFGQPGKFDKTEHMLRPSSGYTSVCRPIAPFNYLVHETSPSSGPERRVMRKHLQLFVQVVNLFQNKIQGIEKVIGRDLLAEFEQVLDLMWANKTAVDAKNEPTNSLGKRKTRDTDGEYAQDDSDKPQVDEPKPSRPTRSRKASRPKKAVVDLTDPFPAMQAALERTTQCITAKNKSEWLEVQTGLEKDLKTLRTLHDTSAGDASEAIESLIQAATSMQAATGRKIFK